MKKYYPADSLKSPKFCGVRTFMRLPQVTEEIKQRVGDAPVFFTFDIDFCDPASAPGTGTVEVEGFNSHETLSLIRSISSLHYRDNAPYLEMIRKNK